jgi:hypothetical protein
VPLCRCGPVGTRCTLGCTQWNVMYVLCSGGGSVVAGGMFIIYLLLIIYLFLSPKRDIITNHVEPFVIQTPTTSLLIMSLETDIRGVV